MYVSCICVSILMCVCVHMCVWVYVLTNEYTHNTHVLQVPYCSADYGFELSLQELTIKKLGLTEQKLKVTHVEDKGDAQVEYIVHTYCMYRACLICCYLFSVHIKSLFKNSEMKSHPKHKRYKKLQPRKKADEKVVMAKWAAVLLLTKFYYLGCKKLNFHCCQQ